MKFYQTIREIWHPNDLLENGFPIWKKIKSQTNNFVTGTFETIEGEIVFHGYHPEYTKYVKIELNKIKVDPLAMKKAVQELTINLKKKIVEAYESGLILNNAAAIWLEKGL